jgi:hypothetical protein
MLIKFVHCLDLLSNASLMLFTWFQMHPQHYKLNFITVPANTEGQILLTFCNYRDHCEILIADNFNEQIEYLISFSNNYKAINFRFTWDIFKQISRTSNEKKNWLDDSDFRRQKYYNIWLYKKNKKVGELSIQIIERLKNN